MSCAGSFFSASMASLPQLRHVQRQVIIEGVIELGPRVVGSAFLKLITLGRYGGFRRQDLLTEGGLGLRRYLEAGMVAHGVVIERHEGTPQGGPLSPLLANVLLDDVDQELEKRGYAFVRYADDCNVYVRSPKAGERVRICLRKQDAPLRLRINEEKSAVAGVLTRPFLSIAFWRGPGGRLRRRVADQALKAMRDRVRTSRGAKSRTERFAGRDGTASVPHGLARVLPHGGNGLF